MVPRIDSTSGNTKAHLQVKYDFSRNERYGMVLHCLTLAAWRVVLRKIVKGLWNLDSS